MENFPPRHNFLVELKELIIVPNIAKRLKMPAKTDVPSRIRALTKSKSKSTTVESKSM